MAESNHNHPRHLEPSELGTKEYWESFYENSLAHLSSKRQGNVNTDNDDVNGNEDSDSDGDDGDGDDDDDGDPGTSWFTEHNAPEKVLSFLTAEEFPFAPANTHTNTQTQSGERIQSQKQPSILDIGTGNGSMLNLLRDEGGFTGSMVGVDYSDKSIELARRLSNAGTNTTTTTTTTTGPIRFEVFDVLDRDAVDALVGDTTGGGGGGMDWFPSEDGGFDIVLDKGTFDAISLSDEGGSGGGERICERYPDAVARLVRRGGYFVITSCNWTESELVEWFTRNKTDTSTSTGEGFVVYDRVEYPKFRFGGQEGQGVCTVCFQRR